MTVRESILEYLMTLFSGIPDATVFRSRAEALARTEGSGIFLRPEEEPVENRAGGGPLGLVVRNFTMIITVITRADGAAESGMTADQVADPIMACVHAKLMADTTLQGRCSTVIEESTKWDFEAADGTALEAQMRYVVRYQTRANTLSIAQ